MPWQSHDAHLAAVPNSVPQGPFLMHASEFQAGAQFEHTGSDAEVSVRKTWMMQPLVVEQ